MIRYALLYPPERVDAFSTANMNPFPVRICGTRISSDGISTDCERVIKDGYRLVPLIAVTPARVAALEYALWACDDYNKTQDEAQPHIATLRELLAQLKGDTDDA